MDQIELGEVGTSIGFLLRLAQVQTFDAFFDALAPEGLRPGEFTLLWVIGLNPGVRQGSLAKILKIKPAHMTKLVQKAVENGHVNRHIPSDDRRSVQLDLTGEGTMFVKQNKLKFLDFMTFEKSSLTKDEFHQFVTLLQKFIGFGEQND
ncbi:MAG: MarR family winged helix-turn-helix transcriptional regulator [Paracoccaceae bacterium]|nr:MarR family winged helix-turn-helix transcriptional regulator [Paracoccaceae bacterium]